MSGILQITDGLSTNVVLDLQGGLATGVGSYAATQPVFTAGQVDDDMGLEWSSSAGPVSPGRGAAEISFVIVGSSPDDLADRVSLLKAATRTPWWLRVRRHGATQDSWLQCYPCIPQVNGRITASSAAHIASGTIQCETEPYALGARVDIPLTTIGQDPSVAGAFALDVNGVQGDADTPLLIRMQDGTAFGASMTTFVSVRRRGTPGNLTAAALSSQAEAGSPGSGTNVTVASLTDSALSGGAGMRATFASGYSSPAAATINFAAPSLSGPDVPGLYRMFVKVRRAAGAGTLTLKPFYTASALTPDDINSEQQLGTAAEQVVDLGLVQWPAGMPVTLNSPVPIGATATSLLLQFWKANAGATTVDFDWVLWVPSDEGAGYLQTANAIPSAASRWVVLDGATNLASVTDSDPISGTAKIVGQSYLSNSSAPKLTYTGFVPHVGPGSNRLFFVTGMSLASSLPKTNTLKVAASYWPRYSWLR